MFLDILSSLCNLVWVNCVGIRRNRAKELGRFGVLDRKLKGGRILVVKVSQALGRLAKVLGRCTLDRQGRE